MKTISRAGAAVLWLIGASLALCQEPKAAVGTAPEAKAAIDGTHTQVDAVTVRGTDGHSGMQTLTVDGKGQVLALVAPPKGFGAPAKDGFGEIHVYSPEGKPVRNFKVNFHAHSINAAPDGTIFVAGDGKVAKFDAEGKSLGEIQLPHIAELLKDNGEMRKAAEAQLKAQKDSFLNSRKQIEDRKKVIEAKKEAERSDLEKQQLVQYEQILKSYEQTIKYYETQTVDAVIQQMTGRLRIINALALSEKDLFIVCGESKGYGYAIWRMDHNFKNAKQVLGQIGGCCGQMDIQVHGSDLLVAENTKHRFARYDRDGKPLGGWGKRGTASEGENFAGCCNPMNLRVAGGDIYTAESEGVIKKFSAKGDFVSLVGNAKLTGGCKNVAVGVSPDCNKVYFCDQPGSRIIILAKK